MIATRSAVLVAVLLVAIGVTPRALDQNRFVGTVLTFDPKSNQLTVSYRESDGMPARVEVWITATTTVTKGKQSVGKAELRPKVSVVVDVLGDGDDDLQAQLVQIVPPAPIPKSSSRPSR